MRNMHTHTQDHDELLVVQWYVANEDFTKSSRSWILVGWIVRLVDRRLLFFHKSYNS